VAELDGRPVVISGSSDRTVRVWDLAIGTPAGAPFTGHTGWVRAARSPLSTSCQDSTSSTSGFRRSALPAGASSPRHYRPPPSHLRSHPRPLMLTLLAALVYER